MYRGPTAANVDTLLPALGTVEALKPEGLSGPIFPVHYFDIRQILGLVDKDHLPCSLSN